MRFFKILIPLLLTATVFVACKKDDVVAEQKTTTESTQKNVLLGTWVGQYHTTTRSAPAYLSFKIKDNYSLDLLNESFVKIGSGTWTVESGRFNARYIVDATGISYKVIGDIHYSPVQLTGEWQYDQDYEDSGFWSMEKL